MSTPSRRRGSLCRRHHGAYRGGRHPFRRQRLLAAALFADPRRSPKSSGRPSRWPAALDVVGLMNVQFAVKDGEVYILEVNPRASRTVPFVAKATGVPIAKIAARVMAGEKLCELPPARPRDSEPACRGQGGGLPVRPLSRLDLILGPGDEIDRRGHGLDLDFGRAFAKAQLGGGEPAARRQRLPLGQGPRQGGTGHRRASLHEMGLRVAGYIRYRGRLRRGRHSGDTGQQGA